MAGKTNGRAPKSRSQRTVAPTMTSTLAIPRLPAPTATVSPRLMGSPAACRLRAPEPGISVTRGRAKVWRRRSMVGSMARSYPGGEAIHPPGSVLYVWANFHADAPRPAEPIPARGPAAGVGRLRVAAARAGADPSAGRALLPGGDGARAPALHRGARGLPQDGRAPSQLGVGAPGPVRDRRAVLPRGRVRQGGEGVRDVPVLLPAPPDRRPRAVPAGHELLRSAQAGRAGPGTHRQGDRAVQ